MYSYTIIFVTSLLCSLLSTPVVRWWAIRMEVIDWPGERRIHSRPVPRLGGVAVFFAVAIAFLVSATCERHFERMFFGPGTRLGVVLAASSIIVLFGALDDAFSFSPGVKLAAQAVSASILMLGGGRISTIGGFHLGILSLPLTLIWLVAITNAFNLIDGLDGLASGVGAIVSAALFANFLYSGDVANAMLLAALCGALIGFLRYNFYPAQIFLGDSGALLIGFVLAAVSMDTGNRPSAVVAIAFPMLALGLPLAETALTMVRRLLRIVRLVRYNPRKDQYEFLFAGKPALFKADRQHIHHRLLDLGLSHRNAVLLLYVISLALSAAAFGIVIYRDVNLALLLGAFGIVSIAGIRLLNYGELHLLRKGMFLPLLDTGLMNRREVQILADLAFIGTSYFAATLIVAGGTFDALTKRIFVQSLPLIAVIQIGAFAITGLYRRSYRLGGLGDALASIKSVLIAVAMSWLACLIIRGSGHPPLSIAILDGYLLATLIIGGRLSFRVLEHVFKTQATGRRRALIYGTGNAGLSALHHIRNNPGLDLRVVGFLDESAGWWSQTLDGVPVFKPRALDDLIQRGQIDEVVLAELSVAELRLEHLRKICAVAGITLRRFSIGWQEVGLLPTSPTNVRIAAG
jgi:UDP-GlcNAc:undecaprenyl-phosphate GlcNAc-1-phosphate transferase